MATLKVWLREPHQSDDEAIKLVVDETADVSDVLLKVPELLRVQHLKPSEIQAEYKNLVLSNRLLISKLFEGVNEGTLVIKPRPGIVVENTVQKVGTTTTTTRLPENELGNNSSLPRQRAHPPLSPRTKTVRRSTNLNTEPMKRIDSLIGERGKPPVARSESRGAVSLRDVGGGTPRSRKADTPCYQRERSMTSRTTTPRRDVSISNSDRDPSRRRMHSDPNSVPSRFRQEAEKVRTLSRRKQTNNICDSFKPQWGKPLCASCNHTKQAHWASHKEKAHVPELGLSSEIDISINEVLHRHSFTPNGASIMATENDTNNVSTVLVGHKE